MTESEREMVKPLGEKVEQEKTFTSLQPTYEDTVPPEEEWGWEDVDAR